uniref:Cation_ATPase_N domain-containing protein n=1 Tax=Schistocephalus solidus TaxID=70667 RepID=A0A183SAK2_SCHSO
LGFADFFELAGTEHLKGHPFELQRKLVHKEVHWNAFLQRVIGKWNGLPDELAMVLAALIFSSVSLHGLLKIVSGSSVGGLRNQQ